MRTSQIHNVALPALLGVCLALAAVPKAGAGAPPCPGAALPGLPSVPDSLRLDRLAVAVEGAESNYGRDAAMWREDPAAAQGPMQVTSGAANDVDGGNRFDLAANRIIGRIYLGLMYRRYGDWPDAIAAYNWGPGHMDAWIMAGCRANALPRPVIHYLVRVLNTGRTYPPSDRVPAGSAILPHRVVRQVQNHFRGAAPPTGTGLHRKAFVADRTYDRWQRQLITAIAKQPLAGSR